jgi:3-methyladenine DNA glycosylase AlkD
MTLQEVLSELESYGDEAIKRIQLKHGVKEPTFGVRVSDLKKIVKKTKKNHTLSLELFDTGNSDAMYLAGLIADENQITKKDLQKWVENASNYGISEYTVAWVAAESKFGFELGLKWIESNQEKIATAGWSALLNVAAITQDEDLEIDVFSKLLDRVEATIHSSPNRVRYTMNGFVIAIGSYIEELTKKAIGVAKNIGKVSVNVGDTACKVPLAETYIQKVIDKGRLGKKRKMARC